MKTDSMELLFEQLSSALFAELHDNEALSLSVSGEDSQFIRINGGLIRQIGTVEDRTLELKLICDQRQATGSLTITGVLQADLERCHAELSRLREEVAQLPVDPFIVLPQAGQTSRNEARGKLPAFDQGIEQLLPMLQGIDITGIWASGEIFRGHTHSAGSKHWFSTDSFSLDYSLVNDSEKMVKETFAGNQWDPSVFDRSLATALDKLKAMDQPSIRIKPGSYRTYIAPAGVSELLSLFSWDGLSEASMRQGKSAFLKMREQEIRLSPLFSLSEDFTNGMVPRFNESGEIAPERLELIEQGELSNCLISSRTAKEYDLQSNFAVEEEWLRSPVMACGELAQDDILTALGTGVYLSNLHYLNWSDTHGGRITGMTRYACFWVDNGQIQGPIENMRFDDSFYHFFGDHLEAVTRESQINPDVSTYEGRELNITQCPGILLSGFSFTL
ncbi:MAG: metallopeptidase TldD-related protein [Gammaproteobacteria bacterium]|nr:metallopeptidase TldD-related protein [Gammaproteobacteria bacterium]